MTMIANGLNYLFQLLSGRILTPSNYGELNSIFSIISIISVIGSALALSIVKHVSEMENNIGGNIKTIFKQSIIMAIPMSILMSIGLIFGLKYDIVSSTLASIATMGMCIAFIPYGILQGKKKFMKVSVFNLIQPAFKTVFGILLLVLGMHFNSVFVAMIIGSVVAILYANYSSKDEYKIILKNNNQIKKVYQYFLFTLISTLCLTIFNNIDVLLIRNYFPKEIVGQYSSASVFGKIVLYIPQALTIIMVPIIAEHKGNEKKRYLSR